MHGWIMHGKCWAEDSISGTVLVVKDERDLFRKCLIYIYGEREWKQLQRKRARSSCTREYHAAFNKLDLVCCVFLQLVGKWQFKSCSHTEKEEEYYSIHREPTWEHKALSLSNSVLFVRCSQSSQNPRKWEGITRDQEKNWTRKGPILIASQT